MLANGRLIITTKEKILLESLKLFSDNGYDSVSVDQIASAVGIKAPSLYKHYKGKQDIFNAIFEESARRYDEFANTLAVHFTAAEKDKESSSELTADNLVKKISSLFSYSLHDEYVCQFRKMLTIEQFRTPELSKLYTDRYLNLLLNYHTGLFTKLMEAGVMKKEDPRSLAMMYDAPLLVLIGECDRHPEREEECLKMLEVNIRLFFKMFSNN